MSTIRRVFKNTGASLLIRIVTPVTSFALVLVISRQLGVQGMGTFSSALSILYIFQAVACLGFEQLITREIAQDKSKASRYLVNCSLIGICFSVIVALIMCATMNFLSDEDDIIKSGYILSISLLPYSLALVSNSICRAFEKYELIAIPHFIGNLAKVTLGLLLIQNGYGLLDIMKVITGTYFVIYVLSLYFSISCIKDKGVIELKFNISLCKFILKTAPVFALIIICNTIRWNVDNLILTKFLGSEGVGLYSAGYKLMHICTLGTSSYIMAVQPIVFRLYKKSFNDFKKVCKETVRLLLIMILPVIVGTWMLSERFIVLIYKHEFLPAAGGLSILIWLLVLSGMNLIIGNGLIASNNQKINLQGNIIAMVCNFCLNLLLIPFLGFIGAAWASLLSSLAFFSFQYQFFYRKLFSLKLITNLKKPIGSVLIMAVGIQISKRLDLLYIVIIAAFIYSIALFALKAITEDDKKLIKELLRKPEKLQTSK